MKKKSNRQLKCSCECNEESILIYQSCSPMWLNLNLCERSKGGEKVILGFSMLYIHSMCLIKHIFLSLSSYFCHITSDVTHFYHFWCLALHNERMWGRNVRWRKLEQILVEILKLLILNMNIYDTPHLNYPNQSWLDCIWFKGMEKNRQMCSLINSGNIQG